MITTLEDALKRISELEAENANLKAELEEYRGRKFAGRQKHDAAWTQSYNDFAVKFESGMTIMEIVAEGKISRRTAYRYKAYYDALRQTEATLEISNLRLGDSGKKELGRMLNGDATREEFQKELKEKYKK
ncbi:resolvase [Butyrivibrio sp. AE2005]|uniref:resolvase n=1 Tax=Butyrivibrio sp. AE2005 TaxID=1496722 RepID=UPI000AF66C0F|nr:resolvase [Butyrivibrio sp. AE2005]